MEKNIISIKTGTEKSLEFEFVEQDTNLPLKENTIIGWDLYSARDKSLVLRKRDRTDSDGKVCFKVSESDVFELCGEYDQSVYIVGKPLSSSHSVIIISP